MSVYTFLDGIIWKAYQVPHLPYEELPPLADYDRAAILRDRAFQYIDQFTHGKKRHVFWGILSYFSASLSHYAPLPILRSLQSISSFMASSAQHSRGTDVTNMAPTS